MNADSERMTGRTKSPKNSIMDNLQVVAFRAKYARLSRFAVANCLKNVIGYLVFNT